MQTVLITIHLIVVLFLIVVVLLQRSEGGGLGIGGGGGMMSARQATDGLTRTTGILAAVFFVTSLSLGILARSNDGTGGVLDRAEQITGEGVSTDDILLDLGGETPVVPVAPGVPTGE